MVLPRKIIYSTLDGLKGIANKSMFAASGVLAPLWLLHLLHAVTTFVHISLPPYANGMTWSLDNSLCRKIFPQYKHL